MSPIPTIDRASVRRDLEQVIRSVQMTSDGAISGTARFGTALVGPPGRLHGGLHAYTRLLSVWQALHGRLPKRVRLELELLKPLRLDVDTPFTGRWQSGVLETRFDGRRGLWGRASPAPSEPGEPLERLRTRARQDPLVGRFRAAGTIPIRLGGALHSLEAPAPADLDQNGLLGRFLTHDGGADAVWTCTTLDLLAAVVQTMAWQRQVFTVRIDLSLTTRTICGPIRLWGDVATRDDPQVPLAGFDGLSPRRVSVWFTDPGMHTVYAWGDVTLYPTRHRVDWPSPQSQ